MDNATTILPKGKSEFPEYLDFDRFRAEGLKHIADLSGRIWTDHNVHDPGITILEALCYALTDLGYRTNLPDADLFARDPKTRTSGIVDDNFKTAAEILGSNPLTILDFRKLLIDIDGVRNAWLEPIETTKEKKTSELRNDLWTAETKVFVDCAAQNLNFSSGKTPLSIRGVYKVLLELEPHLLTNAQANECHFTPDITANVLAEVEKRLHAHRNLCEDFLTISVLKDEMINLCAEIELKSDARPDDVALRIFERLQEFLSPTIRFYTLAEMMNNGKTTDEIFEGRPSSTYSHGFIDADALAKIERRSKLYASDIYRVLLDTEGVEAVKKLRLLTDQNTDKQGEEWVLNLKDGFRPVLDSANAIGSITFFKRGVPYLASASRVLPAFNKRLENRYKARIGADALNLPIPSGEYRSDLGEYYSIQHEFPKNYGIGQDNLPDGKKEPIRWAQALQLKGYLLFYDHLLANYLAELANNRALLSPNLFAQNVSDSDIQQASGRTSTAWLGLPSESFSGLASIGDLTAVLKDGTEVVPQYKPLLTFFEKNTNGGENGFSEGETIAVATEKYATPQSRDHALQQVVDSFDADDIQIDCEEDPLTHLFYILITSQTGRKVVLKSAKTFKIKKDAEKASDKIHFLATLSESYERLDDATQHQYSFSLVYRTPQYATYLRQIAESETTFFQRKNRFFDHLLARFSEDFTDYTLLMFAMNKGAKQQPEPLELSRRFAIDKSRFLQAYPKISENRGRGFNYKITADLWSPKNISGLENRVSKLIGIAEQPTKTLNYFDIEQRGAMYYFTVKDPTQTIILRNHHDYFSREDAQKALDKVLESGKFIENFEPTFCLVEQVYGFRLLDKVGGCPIAVSPDTYGSESLRDTKLAYTHGVLADNGFMTSFQTDTEGVYFQVNNDNQKPIFRSVQAVKKEKTAFDAFINFVQAVRQPENWQDIDEPQGRGFSFSIINPLSPEGNHPFTKSPNHLLAVHPVFYDEKDKRDTARQAAFDFIKNKKQHWQTEEHAARYQWQLVDNQSVLLLKSIHFFKNGEHAVRALQDALTSAKTNDNFERIDNLPNNKFSFYLLWNAVGKGDGAPSDTKIRVGRPPHTFETAHERDRAIGHIRHLARHLCPIFVHSVMPSFATEAQFLEDFNLFTKINGASEGTARLWQESPKFSLNWFDKDDELGLVSDNWFDTAHEAQRAVFELEKKQKTNEGIWTIHDVATIATNYEVYTENDGCSFFFRLKTTKIAAENPEVYFNPTDRNTAETRLITEAIASDWSAFLEKKIASWRFEWLAETSDERLAWILRGYQKRGTQPEARYDSAAARAILPKILLPFKKDTTEIDFSDPHIERVDTPPIFIFFIKNEGGERLAESPNYATAAERDTALVKLIQESKLTPDLATVEVSKICECSNAEGNKRTLDPRMWRVSDEDDRLARLNTVFKNKTDAEVCRAVLLEKYKCRSPQYSEVWYDTDNIFSDTSGRFFFLLRDLRATYWQSVVPFDTADAARAAFDKTFLMIIERAKVLQNYHTVQRTDKNGQRFFAIELTDAQGKTIAEAYQKTATTEGVSGLIARLRTHALLFPIFTEKGGIGFGFHVFDTKKQEIVWENIPLYATFKEAKAGFERFLDLLKNDHHYRLISSDCTTDFHIELVETLLHDAELFATKFPKKDNKTDIEKDIEKDAVDFSWRRVGVFLDVLAKAGDFAFVPTVDYLNCCGYGFQIAADGYRLARHPQTFHTVAEREAARDALWHWQRARNAETTTNTEGDSFWKIIELRRSSSNFKKASNLCSFVLKDENGQVVKDAAGNDELLTQVQWRIKLDNFQYEDIYASEEAANAAIKELVDQSHEAEGTAVYLENLLVLKQADGSMLLAVTRADGSVVTVYEEFATKSVAEMTAAIQNLYQKANESAIVALAEGGFGFEIRQEVGSIERTVRGFVDEDCNKIRINLPVFEVVWESMKSYNTEADAGLAYRSCLDLLNDKNNYARMTTSSDGSPGLMIVNPDYIVATHPRTYTTRAERQKAWINTRQHIHTEGMHLVEHLLLRPRFVGDALMPITPDLVDCDSYNAANEDLFDDYIMGADPYSFWITVVLPHWSERFRDIDFRSFFENTLRREAPAHVAVRIFWVDPQQMQAFERRFRCWLNVVSDAERADYARIKSCFVEVVNSLVNVFPAAVLHDCAEGSEDEIVVLDKTTLY